MSEPGGHFQNSIICEDKNIIIKFLLMKLDKESEGSIWGHEVEDGNLNNDESDQAMKNKGICSSLRTENLGIESPKKYFKMFLLSVRLDFGHGYISAIL